jgi:UDP-2,3-diacylglucosamine hydrolase
VVKGSKPQQDMRFDVPTVGSSTLKTMKAVEARVLALEAGRTLLLDREEMVSMADLNGICLEGWRREEAHA